MKKRKILVVDDDQTLAATLNEFLTQEGYAAIRAATCAETLKLADEHKPDVVLLDLNLPDGSGVQLLPDLARINPDGINVIMTAYADVESAILALTQGASQYLRKPFRSDELFLILAGAFEMISLRENNREAEKALRENEQKLYSLYKAMNEAVVLYRVIYAKSDEPVDYEIIDANPAFARNIGINTEKALGTRVSTIFSAEPGSLYLESFKKVATTGEPTTFETYHPALGKHFRISVFAPAKDKIATLSSDITEPRRMMEEQLKIEKIKATASLAGGIAHDFNNLLAIITGNIELAKEYIKPGIPAESMLQEAADACLRARNLTQKFITFSSGGMPVKKVAPVKEFIKDSTNLALSGSSIASVFFISDDLWDVEIDTNQITQVMNNILSNSRDAMPTGGTVVIVAANYDQQKDNDDNLPINRGKYVKISIQDQGIGIEPHNIARVFEPYFSTKQMGAQKGLGLGLAVAFSVVMKHEGYIHIESQKGVGTTVHVYLPACDKEKAVTAAKPARQLCTGKKLLFMDDEKMVRKLASRVFERLGHTVVLASNGEEAIQLYTDHFATSATFDAVILDLTVKGGLGAESTLARLKEIDPQVIAIASSGYSSNPIMSEFEKHGFKAALIKPYVMDELTTVLEGIFAAKP